MKWILIVWTWYLPNVHAHANQIEYKSQAACERFRTRLVVEYERAVALDSNLGLRISECEPIEKGQRHE